MFCDLLRKYRRAARGASASRVFQFGEDEAAPHEAAGPVLFGFDSSTAHAGGSYQLHGISDPPTTACCRRKTRATIFHASLHSVIGTNPAFPQNDAVAAIGRP